MTRSLHSRRRWIGLGAAIALAGAAIAAPAGDAVATAMAPAQSLPDLGVELLGVRLSGAEFLIDLRYRVKDTAKAQALVQRQVHPVLVNEVTGDRYYVPQAPKIGSLRQSATAKQPVQADKVYFMLFANPDRRLRSGDKVTRYAGDSVVKDLLVR